MVLCRIRPNFILELLFICRPSPFVYSSRTTWWWPVWPKHVVNWLIKTFVCMTAIPTFLYEIWRFWSSEDVLVVGCVRVKTIIFHVYLARCRMDGVSPPDSEGETGSAYNSTGLRVATCELQSHILVPYRHVNEPAVEMDIFWCWHEDDTVNVIMFVNIRVGKLLEWMERKTEERSTRKTASGWHLTTNSTYNRMISGDQYTWVATGWQLCVPGRCAAVLPHRLFAVFNNSMRLFICK